MNENAVQAMGNDELNVIAAELVTNVRQRTIKSGWHQTKRIHRTQAKISRRDSLASLAMVMP